MILIIGDQGSMGLRYRSILAHLGKPFCGFDKGYDEGLFESACRRARYAIIATPTDTHSMFIKKLADYRVPEILCEKPICKDLNELKMSLAYATGNGCRVNMMMQYQMLIQPKSSGDSYYDYFKHGSDGLFWDCMQIIGLAKGVVWVDEASPVWRCVINGKALAITNMDRAYIKFLEHWLDGKIFQEPAQLIRMHEKVINFTEADNEANKSYCRNPGKINFDKIPRQNPGKDWI